VIYLAKVFLFNPPGPGNKRYIREGRCTQERRVWATQWPPLSLATAAALLERDGHTIKVMDFPALGSNHGSLVEMVQKDQPHFAIWNTGTPSLKSDLSLARIVKEVAPETITGIMGTEVTVHPDKALGLPSIDVVIRREPEQTIRNLCLHEDGKWASIDGISYRDHSDGKIHHNPDADFLPPEAIPAPAWRYLDIRPYCLPLKGRPFLIVAPIRGCPYPCSFCTAPIYYGKALRRRPIKDVVDEIEEDIRTFKVKDFFIWADTFTADREYVKRFCREIIDRCLPISWTCNSRVDTVDGELLALMKRAGLWMISFGVESGNNEILQSTGKNITAEQSREALSLTSQLGIRASGHFIFGLPGETEKTMEETLAFALDVPLDITQFYTAAPFPGTALHALALRKGWLRGNRGFSQSRAVMDLPGLPAHRVDRFRRYAYRRFYMRAGTLWRLVSMVEFEAIGNILRDMTYFFQWVRS
jgi:anaerobic magnesium-protoporphyrin IX monomethyl ester cyclase